jgi:hypothetical protein
MKRFVMRSAGFCIFLFVLLVIGIMIPPYGVDDSLLFALPDKVERLTKLQSPKIVLIGGSSCSFGFDSEIIEDSIGMPVVNMAAHAGLGLKYFLDQVREYIKPGDIVLLSLEYGQLVDGDNAAFYGGDVLVPVVVDIDRDAIKDLDAGQWLTVLRNVWLYSARKLITLAEGPIEESFRGEAVARTRMGHYGRFSFNELGDVRKELISKCLPVKTAKTEEGTLLEPALDYLEQFSKYVEGVGAHFFITYSSMQRSSYLPIEKLAGRIHRVLIQRGLTVIGAPAQFSVDDAELFDTPYHLNAKAREMKTKRFVPLLKKHINMAIDAR